MVISAPNITRRAGEKVTKVGAEAGAGAGAEAAAAAVAVAVGDEEAGAGGGEAGAEVEEGGGVGDMILTGGTQIATTIRI